MLLKCDRVRQDRHKLRWKSTSALSVDLSTNITCATDLVVPKESRKVTFIALVFLFCDKFKKIFFLNFCLVLFFKHFLNFYQVFWKNCPTDFNRILGNGKGHI